MKEFMLAHPWLTFFGFIVLVDGTVALVRGREHVRILPLKNDKKDAAALPT